MLYNENLRVGDSAEVMTHGMFYEERHEVLRKHVAQKHWQIFDVCTHMVDILRALMWRWTPSIKRFLDGFANVPSWY